MTESEFFAALPKVSALIEKATRLVPYLSAAQRKRLQSSLAGIPAVIRAFAGDDESTRTGRASAGSKRFDFIWCDADDGHRKAVSRMAELVASVLGIDAPTVKFFRSAGAGETGDFGRDDDSTGFADLERKAICLRQRDERRVSTLDLVAHECRHLWQQARGWDMHNSAALERDASDFEARCAAMLSLPDYAECVLGDGEPPLKFGRAGSLFGTFYFDRKSGHVYRASGDAPWPRWDYHGDLSAIQ